MNEPVNVNRRSEGVHYQMIPDLADEQAWNVRILEGPFSETVIRFDNVQAGPAEDDSEGDPLLHFNFTIQSSPDTDLTPDNVDLQTECGSILMAVIQNAITDRHVRIGEHDLVDDIRVNVGNNEDAPIIDRSNSE